MADRSGKTITLTKKTLESRIRRAVEEALGEERSTYPHRFSSADYDAYIKGIEQVAFLRGQDEIRRKCFVHTSEEWKTRQEAAEERGREEIRTAYPHLFTAGMLLDRDNGVREGLERLLRQGFAHELDEKEAAAKAEGVEKGISDACTLVSKALDYGGPDPRDVPGIAFLAGRLLAEVGRRELGSHEANFVSTFLNCVFELMRNLETETPG